MIEQAIDRRGAFSVPMFDPVVIRLQAEYEPFSARFVERLYAALLGTEAGVRGAPTRSNAVERDAASPSCIRSSPTSTARPCARS